MPEVGRPAAHISESVVSPPGLALPFGGLLWVARSAVVCPGCPWGGAAWHGGCAHISRWWSAPAAPSCRGSRFDSSRVGPCGTGDAPAAVGCRPRAEHPTLAASPPTPSLTPTPRRRDAAASSTADAADADVVALAAVTVTVVTPPIDAADADAAPTTPVVATAAAAAAAAAVTAFATAPVAAADADADAPPCAPYPVPVSRAHVTVAAAAAAGDDAASAAAEEADDPGGARTAPGRGVASRRGGPGVRS